MRVHVTVEECKAVIADYINKKIGSVADRVLYASDIQIEMKSVGSFDDRENVFNGVSFDLVELKDIL